MINNLSFILINPFSLKGCLEGRKYGGLNSYSLDYCGGERHFLREIGAGKNLETDEGKLESLFNDPNTFSSLIKDFLKRDTNIHIILPLSFICYYLKFLKQWNFGNRIYLHLVCNNFVDDLKLLEDIEKVVQDNPLLVIASLLWDKTIFSDNVDWRELQKGYDEIVFSQTQTSISATEYLKKCVDEGKSFMNPVSFIESEPFNDGDVCFIGEINQEKIASLTKAFEVSINDDKRREFNNFNTAFIVKNLPNLKLFVIKSPYSVYESDALFEKDNYKTLPEFLSQNEIRLLQLGDKKHLKLLNKYFNGERGMVYDGHRKLRCEDKFSEKGELMVCSNELLLKKFSDEVGNFEFSMLSFEDDGTYFDEYLKIIMEKQIDCIIVSLNESIVLSTLNFGKKIIDSGDIYQLLCNFFGL